MLSKFIKKISLMQAMLVISCCIAVLVTTSCIVKNAAEYGTVIILNGTSAVGKSSIMRAFQAKHIEPWLGIGIDNFFIGVLPAKFYLEDKPEHYTVMQGVASEDAQGKLFTLHVGAQGQKIMKGMHRAIAAYAKAGNNVIVDYIMYDPLWHDDLMAVLLEVPVITVGVTASLPVVQQREKARATSPEGHARSIYDTVHQGWKYDLEINSDEMTSDQIADKIDDYLQKK